MLRGDSAINVAFCVVFVQLLSAVDMILPHAPATIFNELYPQQLHS